MSTAISPQNEAQRPQILAGRAIRIMRTAHQVGLRELAELIGVSPSHLSRVESGERAASQSLTERICDVIAELPTPEKAS